MRARQFARAFNPIPVLKPPELSDSGRMFVQILWNVPMLRFTCHHDLSSFPNLYDAGRCHWVTRPFWATTVQDNSLSSSLTISILYFLHGETRHASPARNGRTMNGRPHEKRMITYIILQGAWSKHLEVEWVSRECTICWCSFLSLAGSVSYKDFGRKAGATSRYRWKSGRSVASWNSWAILVQSRSWTPCSALAALRGSAGDSCRKMGSACDSFKECP